MPVEGTYAKFDDRRYVYANRLVPAIMSRFSRVVRTHAEMIRDHMKANMEKPKHGRVYIRPGGRKHIASAPGEAPAIDTGKLHKSVKIKYQQAGLLAVIGTSTTDYAGFLEHGTRKIKPRPFGQPAHDAYVEKFRYQMVLAASSI